MRILAPLLAIILTGCIVDPVQYEQLTSTANVPPETTKPEENDMGKEVKRIHIAPIAEYPAYIHDQCGAVWGIPANLQGEYDKKQIHFATDDGTPVSQSEVDIFTLDGAIYITHTYSVAVENDGTPPVGCIDYYKQERGVIAQIDTMPPKPAESRATFKGVNWTLETSIINGTEFSYLYNTTPEMIEAQGNSGGKGAFMGAWPLVSAFVELDSGILIMTQDGALFFPQNRACGNEVSEKGRLWK